MKFTNPYLLQRLKKPFEIKKEENEKENLIKKLATAFSFGGGLVNGGLSDQAMDKLSKIWRYDYMGSAEFEWGAVPKSLERMANKQKTLVTGQVTVNAKTRVWGKAKSQIVERKGTVLYVCQDSFESDVREWIHKLANPTDNHLLTKESVNLAESLVENEYHKDTVGWHDISNDYLFFTDNKMYFGFCELFGIEPVKVEVQAN